VGDDLRVALENDHHGSVTRAAGWGSGEGWLSG